MQASSPRVLRGLLLLGLALLACNAGAAPYRPADDAEVLERLPVGLRSASLRQAAVDRTANDPTIAATLARHYIEQSRREADPRYLGYAQGVLAPWWASTAAAPELILLRATIKQARHEFLPALADLDLLLEQKPDFAQAWLTRATILRVLGRYDAAAAACLRLAGIAEPVVAGICRWSIAGLSGELAQAYVELAKLSRTQSAPPAQIAAWLAAELADMAERLGRTAEAEAHYRTGLTQAPDDLGLRAAYADLLLALQRPREVLALLDGLDRLDAMRLRHAFALQQLADPGFAALDAQIEAGFATAHLRNEELHLREESRYALQAHGDASRALRLAQANWAIQHEPADARVLLDAARAAGRADAAQPVLDFLRISGMQDQRLQTVASGDAP